MLQVENLLPQVLSRFFEVTAVCDLLWNSFGKESLTVPVFWCSRHTREWIKVLLACVYKCQFGKCLFFSFLPRFKYFLYLDPLVTSEAAALLGLLKKYLLFGKLFVSSVQCKIKDRSRIQLLKYECLVFFGLLQGTPREV